MKRVSIAPRPQWQQLAADLGFSNHTYVEGVYWRDDAFYEFSEAEVNGQLRPAINELWQMCMEVVDRAARDDEILSSLQIPQVGWDALRAAWQQRTPSLCTRFDLAYGNDGPPKLHECNGDVPGALFEAAVFQWIWLEDQLTLGRLRPGCDQFNRLHESLVDAFRRLLPSAVTIHIAASSANIEDQVVARYIRDCAYQAGHDTDLLDLEAIGIDRQGTLADTYNRPIRHLVKTYRWELLLREPFGLALTAPTSPLVIEPLWKLILSSKGILVWLWRMFPGHPNLLPSWFETDRSASPGDGYVVKPLFSIKGKNVRLRDPSLPDGELCTPGPYGSEGHVVQSLHPLTRFSSPQGTLYASVGGWIVDGKAEGISIMESESPIISDATNEFVPHVVVP